ncbi:MAG: hypothetical protein J7502_12465, partial [Flavisolibacter sp.]|nr:hypothetical protein [Flavisolibacter sp.]
NKISTIFHLDTLKSQIHVISVESKIITRPSRAVDFNGGYVNYNWNYRSNIDTPFQERNLSQHLITTGLNFTIAQTVPIIITYSGRESNSKYFKDYRDLRVEFNVSEFNRLQSQKLSIYAEQLLAQLRNPLTKPSLDLVTNELSKIENWKNQKDIENMVIQANVIVLDGGTYDSVSHTMDTAALSKAKDFLAMYEDLNRKSGKLKTFKDSLHKEYVQTEKEIVALKKLLAVNRSGVDKKEAIENVLQKHDIRDRRLKKVYAAASAIRTFAIGKTVPNYSELSVKNINLNGINFEYNRGIYFAFSAGAVDYRARDFFYSKVKRKPQFIYLARIGFGAREGSHFFLTAFKGKKQILSSSQFSATNIYGLSFESQLVLKNHRLTGEIAQSSSPVLINANGNNEKSSFDISDEKNRAYSIKLNSSFPKTRSKVEAFYKYRGINFQNFSSYYTNAALHQWSVRGDQYLFKRVIHVNASAAKNTYENPYLLTRYSGNTVFKNITASFKKTKWPGLAIGYMPSSQLSEIDGLIYENFYQALNFSINHQYKLGVAQAFSLFSYNRFYNDARDSGFLYYDAKNYFFNQHFQFLSYTTDINIAHTRSRDYILTVLDAGASAKIWKNSVISFGVKINQLNSSSVKVGLYGSEKISIPKVGELNAWIEKSYLPGWKGDLVKTGLYNIGFFRVIN